MFLFKIIIIFATEIKRKQIMTQKERLYTEYLRLHIELANLAKEDASKWESMLNSRHFKEDAREYKVEELEKNIASVKKSITEQVNRNEIQKWLSTPDGIRYRAERQRNIEKCKNELKSVNEAARKYVEHIVETVCGEKWALINFSGTGSGSLCIGVVESRYQDGSPKAYFGKTFEMRFTAAGTFFDNKKDEVNMSYGSCGSFDINDPVQNEYIAGMGRFLGNKFMIENLREYLLGVSRKGYEINGRLWKEERLLEKPEQFQGKI